MNGTTSYVRQTGAALLYSLSLIIISIKGWGANECAIEFKAGGQTMT